MYVKYTENLRTVPLLASDHEHSRLIQIESEHFQGMVVMPLKGMEI